MPNMLHVFTRATRPLRTVAKAAIFFLKVFPMLPSRPVDWVTKPPVIEKVRYPTRFGLAEGELYRPAAGGPHPGIVVCLGVVPFGFDHPQVPILGKALARAGFVALLYWSPAMRDFRLDPEDIENIALAYYWLIEQPYIDPARSVDGGCQPPHPRPGCLSGCLCSLFFYVDTGAGHRQCYTLLWRWA
jgi:hypothetical protein